ncbi:TetR/AcrR family transcriptional regulator [Paenibacillus chungangensis]|uniref:TetR/AcrR family transcriptional regulator n=1 Tax=Paenibacillus chungangensis TaxID=696535 RepID=A0ABW3HQD0_9BACL
MRRSKAEQKQETIQTLIQTARAQFSEMGYAATPLEKLVGDVGMTRGALYHHFGNKEGLFLAVLQSVQQEIAARIESEASGSDNPWDQLILGCRAFMAAAVEDNNRRILLIDGPSVLGWNLWRRTDEQYAMMTLRDQLQIMQTEGILKRASVDALTHLLSGAMNEAVLWIAESSERQQALEESVTAITLLCEGFRAD